MNDTGNVGLLAASMSRQWLTQSEFDHVAGLDGVGREAGVYDSTPQGSVMVDESGFVLQGGGAGIGSSFGLSVLRSRACSKRKASLPV
jgi:hypothetical protein